MDRILTLLGEQGEETPGAWFWLTMNEEDHEDKLGELTDWIETVFRVQYPDHLAGRIRSCWANHPEAIWEMAWLYQQWSLTYLAEHGAAR